MLLQTSADVDASDMHARTSLFWACKYGDVTCVRVLLEASANVDPIARDSRTSLIWACEYGNEAYARILLI
eukprot:4878662-Pleurochrysis_carterae.AAC.2